MAVPAPLPTVSEQHATVGSTRRMAAAASSPSSPSHSQSAAAEAVHAATAAAAGSPSAASSSVCCPSLDSCLVRLEVAFMTRSEEKHQQLASRLIGPLLQSPHSPAACPLCTNNDRDGEKEAGAGRADESTLSGGELNRDREAAGAAINSTSGVHSLTDGPSRSTWMDGSVSYQCSSNPSAAQQLPQQRQQRSEPCFHCRWRLCQQSSLPAVQCMETVVQTVSRVELAKALEGPVKAFQRHNTTGQPFREDVARIIDLLCNADEADMRRLDNILPVTRSSSGSHSPHSSDGNQPQQRQRQVLVKGEMEECKELAEDVDSGTDVTLYDVDEDGADTHHASQQQQQQQQQHEAAKPLRGCPVLPVGLSSLSSSRSRRAVLAVTLLCCKFATENAPFNLRKSEIVKRKVRGLRLLLHLLQHVPHAYRCTRGGVMLLRRFVCPSLLTACITDVPVVFRLVLTIFRYLYDATYRCHLLIELGTLVDMMFLPLLESTHCTIQQKRDIVDTIAHCCSSSQQVVALYYNFDNRVPTWPIFERCVAVVAKLCEGEIKYTRQQHSASSRHATLEQPLNAQSAVQHKLDSKPAAAAAAPSSLAPPSASSPSVSSAASSSHLSSSAEESDDSSHIEALRKHCLRLLVQLLHMQAQWLGLPGVQRPQDGLHFPPPAAILANSPASQHDTTRMSASGGSNTTRPSASSVDIHVTPPSPLAHHTALASLTSAAAVGTGSPASSPSDFESALAIHSKRMEAAARNSTWMSRVDQQKADADIERRILKLAHNDGLNKAVRELRVLYPQSAWPQEIAHFLHRHESKLDKAEVGELLSGLSDSLLSQPEYESLRDHFLALLDFCGLSFEAALRVFLTSSGFRLPGEAQKIDRMLATFCKAYVNDNLDVFPNADAAFILAFALVMLNTDQHNASMKGRQPMTEQQFISNLRGVNNGVDFPRSMLAEAYHSIKTNEIAFLADRRPQSSHSRHGTLTGAMMGGSHQHSPSLSANSAAGLSPTLSSIEASGEVARSVSKYKAMRDSACRSFLEQMVRKTLAYLKNAAVQQRALYLPVDSRIVIGMYDVSWLKCCAAITATLETSQDVDTLHCCLDGLMYGACLAVALRLPMERQAFIRVLAKLTFMERQCGSFSSASLLLNNVSDEQAADCQRRVLAGEHLKQEWCRAANLYSDKQPLQAVQLLQHTCRDTAKKLNSERRLSLIKQLQEAFGNEIQLTDNKHRALVKQGKLTKVSPDGKRRTYFFFLFNDILVYASAGVQQQYKYHRCLHLSLCRIEDVRRRPPADISAAAAAAVSERASLSPSAASTEPSVSSRPSSAPAAAAPSAYAVDDDSAAADSQSTTFRLVSPQKSILLCADSADKKRAWIGALLTQIKQQAKKRSDYVRQANRTIAATSTPTNLSKPQQQQQQHNSSSADSSYSVERTKAASSTSLSSSGSSSASLSSAACSTSSVAESDSSEELRRYSTFIGSDWSSRLPAAPSATTASRRATAPSAAHGFCKLCLRSFSLFRRRLLCDWCSDAVCNECADNRLTLPVGAPAATVNKLTSSGSIERDSTVNSMGRSTSDPAAPPHSKEHKGEKARVCDACCGVLTGAVALVEADNLLYTVCMK